jgi:sugar-phosphatase
MCDALIFDLDGILVDSSSISERHWRAWADRHDVPFERIAAIHLGRTIEDTIRVVAPHLDAKAEARLRAAAEADDTDGLLVFKGAARLLARLPSRRWAIVTSATRHTATTRLAHVGLPTPAVLVTADDVDKGKPDREPYLKAAERLGIDDTSRCVVLEDASAGVEAARAAKARVIGVASTSSPESLAGATVIVACLEDIGVELQDGTLEITWRAAL